MLATAVDRGKVPPVQTALQWLNENRSDLVLGLIPPILVGILVWLVGRPVAWWQRRKELADARRALAAEIEANLTQLTALWQDVNRPPGALEPSRPKSPDLIVAFRLAQLEPIRWRRSVWEDRAVKSIAALDADMLTEVTAFYDDLNRFDVLKGSLGKPVQTLDGTWRLQGSGEAAWNELQEVVARRLRAQNPLAETLPETSRFRSGRHRSK